MTSYATGACYCKKVNFKVATPAHWVGHCHCRQCQKLHGAAFVSWATFKTTDYSIDDPHDTFRTVDTGKADRGFCSHCGSSFYFAYHPGKAENAEWENSVSFTLAHFDTPLNQKPECHIFHESSVPWLEGWEDLPEFEWGAQ